MTKKNIPAILITGAMGNVGRELTKQLSAQKAPFRRWFDQSRVLRHYPLWKARR